MLFMKKCTDCQGCEVARSAGSGGRGNFVLVGNMNVGKSTLFGRLCGSLRIGVNIPGSTVAVEAGCIKNLDIMLYDTPGIHSIFSANEDERASRDILLTSRLYPEQVGIVMVADAKNLKRSIAVALQYVEYGLPMIMVVNMIDEIAARGIEIDFRQLSEKLGMEVLTTIAREGIGVRELASRLVTRLRPPTLRMEYSVRIEQFLASVGELLGPHRLSHRALGLLLLAGDQGVEPYIRRNFGDQMFERLARLADQYNRREPTVIEVALATRYQKDAARIAAVVQKQEAPARHPFILTFGDWCTRISTGVPIAVVILSLMYLLVGSFGATFLVDSINGRIFEGFLIPLITRAVAVIPVEFIRDMLVDPDFGVLPTGVFLALGLVLPVIFCFYLAFGTLEDSGYLPRISLLLDRVFRKMGLNGKGVIPLLMGFSCVTMALLTTRVLDTEKEKNIASFLLFLCMPCAPLIAVMLVILDRLPFSATLAVFGLIFLQLLLAGYLADRILPGCRGPLIMEIPAMRFPKPGQVIRMAGLKTYFFMKEAVPVFIYASLAVFIFQRLGGLEVLEKTAGPLMGKVMGLPDKSIQVFIKTMIRRESGAAELEHLSVSYTNLQLVVNLLVMTFIAPCLNSVIVLFKERGPRAAAMIMGTVIVYAIVVGGLVNYVCHALGITFT